MESKDFSQLQVLQKADIHVKTDLGVLSHVLSWFDQFDHPAVPKYIWMQCQLALAEGFTNAVRHAHKNQPPEVPIDIEVAIFPQHLEMRIWDRGQPFDLEGLLKNMPPVEDSAEGGRGVKLMQRIADIISYKPTGDRRNCLLMVKYYPSAIDESEMSN